MVVACCWTSSHRGYMKEESTHWNMDLQWATYHHGYKTDVQQAGKDFIWEIKTSLTPVSSGCNTMTKLMSDVIFKSNVTQVCSCWVPYSISHLPWLKSLLNRFISIWYHDATQWGVSLIVAINLCWYWWAPQLFRSFVASLSVAFELIKYLNKNVYMSLGHFFMLFSHS